MLTWTWLLYPMLGDWILDLVLGPWPWLGDSVTLFLFCLKSFRFTLRHWVFISYVSRLFCLCSSVSGNSYVYNYYFAQFLWRLNFIWGISLSKVWCLSEYFILAWLFIQRMRILHWLLDVKCWLLVWLDRSFPKLLLFAHRAFYH